MITVGNTNAANDASQPAVLTKGKQEEPSLPMTDVGRRSKKQLDNDKIMASYVELPLIRYGPVTCNLTFVWT